MYVYIHWLVCVCVCVLLFVCVFLCIWAYHVVGPKKVLTSDWESGLVIQNVIG